MKVIKEGRDQEGWARECTCTGHGNKGSGDSCGAELLVEQDDLFSTCSTCMGETDCYVTFECPLCGIWTDIDNSPFYPDDLPNYKTWKRNHPNHRKKKASKNT